MSDLGESECAVESARDQVVLGNLKQQTPAAGTGQSVRNRRQQPAGDAAAAKRRQDAQRQYFCFRPDGKGDHEPNGLLPDPRDDAEAAGHGQKLGHRRFVPGAGEAAGMQGGRNRQVERPERLQQDVVGVAYQRFEGAVVDGPAAAGDDRTSGARRYSGVGGNAVRSASARAASCATQYASAGPSANA